MNWHHNSLPLVIIDNLNPVGISFFHIPNCHIESMNRRQIDDLLARLQRELCLWVICEQAQQFHTGIARTANDANLDYGIKKLPMNR